MSLNYRHVKNTKHVQSEDNLQAKPDDPVGHVCSIVVKWLAMWMLALNRLHSLTQAEDCICGVLRKPRAVSCDLCTSIGTKSGRVLSYLASSKRSLARELLKRPRASDIREVTERHARERSDSIGICCSVDGW